MTEAVNDFSALAGRLREIDDIRPSEACAEVEEIVCPNCEGGGWECYGLDYGDPHFKVCSVCGNPKEFPSP